MKNLFEFDKLKITDDSTLFDIKLETPILRFMPSPYTGKTMIYQSKGRSVRSCSMTVTFEMDKHCIIEKYIHKLKNEL
jgi:hypothetical protein